jgi:hypothetical protein
MSGAVATWAVVSAGAPALPLVLSGARLVDAAVSLLFVAWLSRYAGRLHLRREAERQEKIVPFPRPE